MTVPNMKTWNSNSVSKIDWFSGYVSMAVPRKIEISNLESYFQSKKKGFVSKCLVPWVV
jgi:hypothetical protein